MWTFTAFNIIDSSMYIAQESGVDPPLNSSRLTPDGDHVTALSAHCPTGAAHYLNNIRLACTRYWSFVYAIICGSKTLIIGRRWTG